MKIHPAFAARLARGEVKLHGWLYHIQFGEITTYDAHTGRFVPLDHDVPRPRRRAAGISTKQWGYCMNHEEGERSNQNHSAELSGNTGHLVRDLAASLVVFLIASPLCMGIAIASGLPRRWGLPREWSAGLSLEQFPALPSRVSGPAAGLSVIVFELVHDLGPPMLGPILLLAGLIQFVCGRLKLGQWFRAISPAIVYGMLAGIGILIIAGQFHVMVDDKPRASGLANLPAIPDPS